MTKEDVEDASGEGEQKCWIGEKGCHESSEVESGRIREVAAKVEYIRPPPIYGDKPGSKLMMIMMCAFVLVGVSMSLFCEWTVSQYLHVPCVPIL